MAEAFSFAPQLSALPSRAQVEALLPDAMEAGARFLALQVAALRPLQASWLLVS